ncbi:MAG: hypothetical protein LC687_08230 [Actinobacteria bacterium]|nr:hypothetical protein [Actinomycetota bacterium]
MNKLSNGTEEADWNTPKANAQHGINVLQQRITDAIGDAVNNESLNTPDDCARLISALAPAIIQYNKMRVAVNAT